MASTVPPKSRSLHHFSLPHLKWNKEEHAGGPQQRRSAVKSPLRRTNMPSPSPLPHSPLRRDSVSATPPRLQSLLRDSTPVSSRDSPVGGDYFLKQFPISGESSRRSPINEWMKQSDIDCDSERHFLKSDLSLESEVLGKSKGSLIEYRKYHSKYSANHIIRNGISSSDSEQAKDKIEMKSEESEVDLAGNKRSKILIKIPCKNNTLEEENPEENPSKTDNCNDDDETHKVREEEKINHNNIEEENKTWNLRPRRPMRKSKDANVGVEKGNVSGMSEKRKAHSPLMNANRSREKEGNCSGASEKKEKRKLSISIALSKEEIEEDIFALTGSKPARRPKKRAKNIQKQVDFVFPGLWLVSVTRDSYKVFGNSLKG